MTNLSVRQIQNDFEVTVDESSSKSTHRVSIPEAYYQKLTKGRISKEDCLKASFRFLLEREPKECILGRFELSVISGYFPEFEKEFKNYIQ